MDNPIHILHLEDNAADAELIQVILKEAGIDCLIKRIQTREEFFTELQRGGHDIILTDYRLPGFDGMSALRITCEMRTDIPFIFVSGTMGEDAAIEALTQGATDYVLKHRLSRLAPAIRRAILEAENQRERGRAEKKLLQSEERLRLQGTALEAAANGIMITDREGTIIWVNRAFALLTGYSASEIIGQNSRILKSEEHDPPFFQNIWNTILSGQIWQGEVINRRRDGALYTEEMTIAPVRDEQGAITHFIAIKQDITERKRSERLLKKTLEEKETLLLELHHRTNNNMGMITALLNLQASEVEDERLKTAFTETKNRIHSMALVHQILYDSHDLSRVNLREYLIRLINSLTASYGVTGDRIATIFKTEDLFVLFDTAIPCGLILSELISNTLKYAFPGDRQGEITIEMKRMNDETISLCVADNGVGVPPGFDFRTDGHLGLRNVFVLGENQLNGRVSFTAEHGVTCHLEFQDNLYSARV